MSLQTLEHPVRGPETAFEQLLRLDASRFPGLSECQFNRVFTKCHCGLIMTCRVFQDHLCTPSIPSAPVVIDLTSNDKGNIIDLTSE
jgi:hypothetical protein